jgi:hypothetical protein
MHGVTNTKSAVGASRIVGLKDLFRVKSHSRNSRIKRGILGIELNVQRYALVESAEESGPAAFWQLSAIGNLVEDRLSIKYERADKTACDIAMKWQGIKIASPNQELKQCELGGRNTHVGGTYWRKSAQKPHLGKK